MNRTPSSAQGITQELEIIKIEDDDDEEEEEEAIQSIDLTDLDDEQEGPDALREIDASEAHNSGGLPSGCVPMKSAPLRHKTIETIWPGDSVEFDDIFLRVVRIFRNFITGEISLKGNRMGRLSDLEGMAGKNKANELFVMLSVPATVVNPKLEDYCITRPLSAAICKRIITLTNKSFPAYSVYEWPPYKSNDLREIKKSAHLACRLKRIEFTTGNKVTGGALMTLSEDDCKPVARASELSRLHDFLSKKREAVTEDEATRAPKQEFIDITDEQEVPSKKRTYDDMRATEPIDLTGDCDVEVVKRVVTDTIERTSSTGARVSVEKTSVTTKETRHIPTMFPIAESSPRRRPGVQYSQETSQSGLRNPISGITKGPRDRYTFGDICTGAGGMASGARQAGLKMNFLLDHWPAAYKTLCLNFTNMHTKVLLKTIYEFCTNEWTGVYYEHVDILHISFPCQPHSAVHTVPGKNDADNIATSYSVGEILERCKPRIVTFEQTSGIVTHRGGHHFRALLKQIRDAGYNVRWQICNLAWYGNVQPRKRLIIIAACPGEILPSFPEPTHGPGKLPFVTVNDVLQKISHLKVPTHMKHSIERSKPSYDGGLPMKGCITCDGGPSNLHPSGERTFNLFELAALQGFPPTHQFDVDATVTDIKKQIGNAVPSMFAKALFEHIALSLQESDRKRASWNPNAPIDV
jgi:DNA (cytosine-5)-methyltransferase 1